MNIQLACFTKPQRELNNLVIKKKKSIRNPEFQHYNDFSISRLFMYVQCDVFSDIAF